jgi:ketosteroid isomerase-like protein
MADRTLLETVERLIRATNAHDVDGVVSCFAEDYALEAPLHPARSFRGREQVRRNWTQIFGAVPDIVARLVRAAVEGDTVWTEWEMSGTRRDQTPHLMRGVFIFGIAGDQVHWGRMFLEPVDDSQADMNTAVRDQLHIREVSGAGGPK